ncbi:leucine-rich repeat, cysteine-containing subtype protein [Tanacetum coccineum]
MYEIGTEGDRDGVEGDIWTGSENWAAFVKGVEAKLWQVHWCRSGWWHRLMVEIMFVALAGLWYDDSARLRCGGDSGYNVPTTYVTLWAVRICLRNIRGYNMISKKFFDIVSKTRKHVTVHVHFAPDPKRVSHRFPNLKSLTLKSYSWGHYTPEKCCIPVTPWILETAVKFEILKSLSIRNMVLSAFDLQPLAKNRGGGLRSLEIRGCKMFSEDGLEDIARCCSELTSLRLGYNWIENDYEGGYRTNGKWFHELALCNTVMESLDFDDPFDCYDMEDVTLLAKKCSKSLVSLNISSRNLSDFREVFKHAKKLDHFGYGIIDVHPDSNGFRFPPNIRGLRIEYVTQASFPFLLPYFHHLRELDLKCVPNCPSNLFKWSPSLEVLHTQDNCGDKGLQVIGQFCKKLRKLTRYGLATQMGLIAVAQGCPNLEYLEFTLFDISNEALECVGTRLKNLHDFRIFLDEEGGIEDFPLDNGVQAMLMGCTKLERLDIDLCLGVLTDVGLGYIGEYGHNLRHLSLSYTGESDVGLLELLKGCPKLRKLKLNGCPFSEQAITSFVFSINQSLRYAWLDYGSPDVSVLTRPMVSAQASIDLLTIEPPLGLVT